jgi:drug/metabolite transporter (DMT)-like permease
VRRARWTPSSHDLALVGAAACFGFTFVVVKDAIGRVDPIAFLTVRFAFGAAVLWIVARGRPRSPRLVRDGTLIGVALLGGFVFQTVGLQYTDAATSAFITYLLVVLVPLIGVATHRRRPHPAVLGAILASVVGLALLTGAVGSGGGFGRGEALTAACALAFAIQVVLLGEWSHRHDPLRLAATQVTVVAVACAVPGAVLGTYRFPASATLAALATGLVATAGGFSLQVYGQRAVPPSRAALILLLETVFAALLAAVTGDPLDLLQYLGAAVILGAIVLGELTPSLLDRRVELGEASPDNDRS